MTAEETPRFMDPAQIGPKTGQRVAIPVPQNSQIGVDATARRNMIEHYLLRIETSAAALRLLLRDTT